eukprot:m.73604 g.73604  ORF g.73604 m.73604 type:complete len:320 (-) comp13041_c0_seq3:27-986(-)
MAEPSSLHLLAKEGVLKSLQTALPTSNPNVRDGDGMTPLHYAAWYGHPLCVLALIEAGADINAFDSDGATALHAAAYNGQLSCAVALVEAGANCRITDNDNKTAKDVATDENQAPLIAFLREAENFQTWNDTLKRCEAAFNEARERCKAAESVFELTLKDAKKTISEQDKEAKKIAKQTLKLKKMRKAAEKASMKEMRDRRGSGSESPTPFSQMSGSVSRASAPRALPAAATPLPPPAVTSDPSSKRSSLKDLGASAPRSPPPSLQAFMETLDLKDFTRLLEGAGVTFERLRTCTLQDLKDIGLPQGASKRILSAFAPQ